MRTLISAAILIATAAAASAGNAQAPTTPRQLDALIHQDATLRDRIGRIQLDALVARVDQTIARKAHLDGRPFKAAALKRDLDLYAF